MAKAMATKYFSSFTSRYEKLLGLSKFASFDETQIHSEITALRSIVMADHTPSASETIKILATEPVTIVGRSQIQEFMDFYGGEGIQHIALLTSDIISTVTSLHARGVEFLKCPPKTYYDHLRKVLASGCESGKHPEIKEDIDVLEKLHILLDYDENGYLLQILTCPLQDKPTMFIEVIERHGHKGFGEGNFKALFQAIERDQAARGTLFTAS
ncbi:4-hydroxyphenylpyruvate dioxygenase [Mitosporidium daphniae]|uniref:4-hydroxyphenylpyruvate dioxygenase n=1 Tax=Mitosporidium daphniae TaxID=1485682 RepID=A0A098VSI6_9MICR|nr:4-hydroxyphenylpyruvate dioxygenase [Mitosporidium daphniae]KGG51915.1 4-hydroxyphenylpyruvate dioxygenase [Mitosporidium daphniae]|eukprot:XP_013238351.1 4-hydroxyphenylpyruvate dioxygenase [Mitosporidium daphniae]